MKTLDPLHLPLSGVHLIEASAGTGKTYTITGLYLRLLLEKELSPANILVVTYTEAASQELRDGIRQRLVLAQSALETGESTDLFLRALINKYAAQGLDLARLRAQIALALLDFDLAAVFTIHGFCLRVLQDSAFESGYLFETEFIENDHEILQQVVDDYWRRHSPTWPDILQDYLFDLGFTPDSLPSLAAIFSKVQASSDQVLHFPERLAVVDFNAGLLRELVALWQQDRVMLVGLLLEPKLFNKPYTRENVAQWAAALDTYCGSGGLLPAPFEAIRHLRQQALLDGTRKARAGETPRHGFFELCGQLVAELQAVYYGLLHELILHGGREVAAVKLAGGLLSFDDLLTGVRDGLRAAAAGPRLAARLARQYPAALIDEFQDTDPVQYEVFARIYLQGPGESLFLVGDPKQAIYGFRGADIYAYLQASRVEAAAHHTLGVNWRSVPGLVDACNRLFGRHPRPFVLPEITFQQVASPERCREELVIEGHAPAPLLVYTFAEQLNRDQAKERVARWTAGAVRQLLDLADQGRAYFTGDGAGRRPLCAADIAILVRSHKEGELVRQGLADGGMKAVVQSRRSVFFTAEARELQLVLTAVAHSADESLIRPALACRLMGLTAADLVRLEESASPREDLLARFVEYKRLWLQRGVAPMLYSFFAAERVFVKLAAQDGGERVLTNLRHLVELLQEAEHQDSLGPEGLIHWLRERRHTADGSEANQLRLESDENLVRIVTVHKSKGLQYPVVLCPFLWDSVFLATRKKDFVSCHERGLAVVDFGTAAFEARLLLEQKERLSEELRLLYVALTRAMQRLYLFWGRVRSGHQWATATSALQYLLSCELPADSDPLAALKELFKASSGAEQVDRLQALAAESGGVIAVQAVPAEPPAISGSAEPRAALAAARQFSRQLNRNLGIRSFSSLHQHQSAVEEPDHDRESGRPADNGELLVEALPAERSVFGFPGGAQAGSCLHAILEKYDFQETDQRVLNKLIAEQLALFGFERQWLSTVGKWLAIVVATALDDRQEPLALNQISRRQRLDELEFYYSVPALQERELRALFAGAAAESTPPTAKAFMKGFVDLVFQWRDRFYIVDYKSNYLGREPAAYGRQKLQEAMVRAGYDLQYHIYTVALHRYLRQRLPGYAYEDHFGGVYYLFLRGMHFRTEPGSGVYFDRPEWQKIEHLNRLLL